MSQSAADDEHELQTVFRAARRGMSTREIATILYGEAAVSEQWYADSVMRDRTRRRIHKARQLMQDEHSGPVDGP